MPGEGLEEGVVGEDADVLWEVGVVDAGGGQAEHFGGEECSEAERSGSGDDDFSEFFALDVIDDFEDGWEAEFLEFVFREFEFSDGLEVFEWEAACGGFGGAGDDGEVAALGQGGLGHAADGGGDAVDVIEGVGEPRAAMVFEEVGAGACEGVADVGEPGAVGGLALEGVDVGGEEEKDGDHGAGGLDGFDEAAGGDFAHGFVEEAVGELVGEEVGHDEGAALGFLDAAGVACEERFEVGVVEVGGEFLPEGGAAGFGEFEDFAAGDALCDEADFFFPGKLGGVFAFQEAGEGAFDELEGGALGLGELGFGELEEDVVEAVGDGEGAAGGATGAAVAATDAVEEFGR